MYYLCDPDKNTSCSKGITCGKDCVLTTHKEYARECYSGFVQIKAVLEIIESRYVVQTDDGTAALLKGIMKDIAALEGKSEDIIE